MDDPTETSRLRQELAAARKTIDALMKRVEVADSRPAGLDQHAVLAAMSNLESIIDQRTQELASSEELYRAMYDHNPLLALTVDVNGVVLDANQTFAAAFETATPDLIGRLLPSFFSVASADEIRALVTDGLHNAMDVELTDANGRTLIMTAAAIPGFGGDCQVVLVDVTDHRELAAELQHSRRLAAIGHLAAGVAHEINNPLAVIQGRVELIEILGLEVSPPVQKHLTLMGQHAKRIARIVRSLSAFARPRATEPELVAVQDLVSSAAEIASASIADITLEVDIEPPRLSAQADRWQIERVLVNLLNNAADAMPHGGIARVVARRHGDMTRIEVMDGGPGIPDELLDQLFAPFVSGKSRARRSGLGLAITWSIIQEHGGTIRAANLETHGAVFTFTLPWSDGSEPATTDPDVVIAKPLRVLCIEDEAAIVQIVHRVAESAGHSVITARSAEEALELARENDFDVVLSDIRLPGMSGIELRERLGELNPKWLTHTVLMSGYFQELPAGVPYLQKPFRSKKLLRLLQTTASRPVTSG